MRRPTARIARVLCILVVGTVAGTATSPILAAPEVAGAAEESPRLIVLISVDQLGSELFERLRPVLQGGFKLLLDRGVEFRNAVHRHAKTQTAPGHATVATGVHPRHHGIIGNWWLARGEPEKIWSVDDDEHDKSPGMLERSTLGDWIKEEAATAKVIAVSAKDRSAILLGGRTADAAVWYDDELGKLVSSSYYPRELLADVFDSRRFADQFFGRIWNPLPIEESQLAGLGIEMVDMGPRQRVFPHVPGSLDIAPAEDFYDSLWDSPWLDELVIEFAEQVLEAERLGMDDVVDLLALSFSASDSVGHDWGPNSREHVDVVLRLDRLLGDLFQRIDGVVGLERTVIALTADHGSVPAPEVRRKWGRKGEVPSTETVHCVQSAGKRLAEIHGVERWLVAGPFLADGLESSTGLSRGEIESRTAAEVVRCPSVTRVWTRSELLDPGEGDEIRELFANSFFPDRSPDFLIQFDEYFMSSRSMFTTHGTVYEYDRRVPILILGPRAIPGPVNRPVATVDIAPTLAALAGVPYPDDLDGTDLTPLLERTAD